MKTTSNLTQDSWSLGLYHFNNTEMIIVNGVLHISSCYWPPSGLQIPSPKNALSDDHLYGGLLGPCVVTSVEADRTPPCHTEQT